MAYPLTAAMVGFLTLLTRSGTPETTPASDASRVATVGDPGPNLLPRHRRIRSTALLAGVRSSLSRAKRRTLAPEQNEGLRR